MSPDETALGEVVVTATRTPKTLKDAPVVTRLISAEDIARTDATNIQDLLTEEIPGLEFGFAMSQETSLNMSGFGGNAILFYIPYRPQTSGIVVVMVCIVRPIACAEEISPSCDKTEDAPGMLISIHATVRLETNGAREVL